MGPKTPDSSIGLLYRYHCVVLEYNDSFLIFFLVLMHLQLERMSSLVSELAVVTAQGKAMLDECEALLASTAAMQVRLMLQDSKKFMSACKYFSII